MNVLSLTQTPAGAGELPAEEDVERAQGGFPGQAWEMLFPATTSGSSFLVGWEVFECLQCFALQYLDAKAMQCCKS